jgi:hypothetical protein
MENTRPPSFLIPVDRVLSILGRSKLMVQLSCAT